MSLCIEIQKVSSTCNSNITYDSINQPLSYLGKRLPISKNINEIS